MFIIATEVAGSTYRACICTVGKNGLRKLYAATCTQGHLCAAKQVLRRWYGNEAAESVSEITNAGEINQLLGDCSMDAKRHIAPRFYKFNH